MQIEQFGRNWGVKNAGLLALGSGMSAGISWSTGTSPRRILSVTFESPSQAAERNAEKTLKLPHAISADEAETVREPVIYPENGGDTWKHYADVLARHAAHFEKISPDTTVSPHYADAADLAAFELAWCFEYPGTETDVIDEDAHPEYGEGVILSIREHILRNRETDIDYKKIAEDRGLSFTTFRRRWQKVVGESPGEFLSRARMEKARYLLSSTSKPIGDIAKETGYSDQLYFSRRFHHYHGVSPREFRRDSAGT